MNRVLALSKLAVLLLAVLSGCPGPERESVAAVPDTSLAAQDEICETLPLVDSVTPAAADSGVPEPKPESKPEPRSEPEPEPESPPEPNALPRMWDRPLNFRSVMRTFGAASRNPMIRRCVVPSRTAPTVATSPTSRIFALSRWAPCTSQRDGPCSHCARWISRAARSWTFAQSC